MGPVRDHLSPERLPFFPTRPESQRRARYVAQVADMLFRVLHERHAESLDDLYARRQAIWANEATQLPQWAEPWKLRSGPVMEYARWLTIWWGRRPDDARHHTFPALHEYTPPDPYSANGMDPMMPLPTFEISVCLDLDDDPHFTAAREQFEAECAALKEQLRAEGAWSRGIEKLRRDVEWFVRRHIESEKYLAIATDARVSQPRVIEQVRQVGALLGFPDYIR